MVWPMRHIVNPLERFGGQRQTRLSRAPWLWVSYTERKDSVVNTERVR